MNALLMLVTGPFKALITWRIESPLFHSLNRKELCEYLGKYELRYKWQRTDDGIVGELDRGFGRFYRVTWSNKSNSLTLENGYDRKILFYTSNHVATVVIGIQDQAEANLMKLTLENYVSWTKKRP